MAVRSHFVLMAALVVSMLAGCGDDDHQATERNPVTCSTQAPTPGQPTAPGVLLCPGATGNLPLTDAADRHHLVPVTVVSVDKVPRSQIDRLTRQQLDIEVDPTGIDIYAVHATARLAEPARLDPLGELLLYSDEHDYSDPHLLATWSPAGCVHERFTAAMPPDTTIDTCDWRWVTRDAELTGVTLGSEIEDYAVYGGNPVSWSLRDDQGDQ